MIVAAGLLYVGFIIVDKNKQRGAELVICEIMQALVHRTQDEADPDAEMKLKQFPSLWSRLSQGGYTSEAAELDRNIFNHSTLTKSFSKPIYFDMGINFGTEESATAFPLLPVPANPWKPHHKRTN